MKYKRIGFKRANPFIFVGFHQIRRSGIYPGFLKISNIYL